MPYEIKQKLRQYAKACEKSSQLSREVDEVFEKYGFSKDDIERISGDGNDSGPSNEALSYICNAEGGTEESIEMIEEVFLWVVNKKEREFK